MTSFSGKKVIITGAGGFVGSHLVEALVQSGAEVRALVHYNGRNDRGNLEHVRDDVLDAVEVVAGDIQDSFSIAHLISGREVVFHLAALIGIPYSYLAPKSYVDANVLGTLNVLEAARAAGVERVVHTSTSETYGTAQYTPIDERHPLQAQSPYSASKIGADKIAESYHRAYGLPVTTLRPFNTFGPRQSLRAVIPTITAQALSGDRIRLGSLSPVRDFLYVTDTVGAFMAAALSPDTVGETFNAGTGTGITIGELAELIQASIGTKAEVVVDDARVRPDTSEVFQLICDATRLRSTTGWRPLVSLRDGLASTAEWMRDRPLPATPATYTV